MKQAKEGKLGGDAAGDEGSVSPRVTRGGGRRRSMSPRFPICASNLRTFVDQEFVSLSIKFT